MYEEKNVCSERIITILAITVASLTSFALLKSTHYIVKYQEDSGINAISRNIGFIVIALGIEYMSPPVIFVLGKIIDYLTITFF